MVLAAHLYRRMMRPGRVAALIALASVPALVYWLTSFDASSEAQERLYADIMSTAGFSYVIAALILTAATLREERDEGTLPYIYMRPIGRFSIALSAMLAGTLAALTVALAGWGATVLAAALAGVDLSVTLPGLTLFAGAAIGYAALFVPLGYMVPRSLLVGLGYVLVVESIMANVVTGLAQFSIWRIALSIFADLAEVFSAQDAGDVLGPVTPGAGGGTVKLAAAALLGLAALTWALRERDAV